MSTPLKELHHIVVLKELIKLPTRADNNQSAREVQGTGQARSTRDQASARRQASSCSGTVAEALRLGEGLSLGAMLSIIYDNGLESAAIAGL